MGRRAIVIVLDGLGVGDAPDAADFGDEGANTLANTAMATGGLKAPNLQAPPMASWSSDPRPKQPSQGTGR
jgi:phosphopentomutase